jgi:hypothetical protein
MALVQVARFLDPTEAQVAASALRSAGMFVMLQSETLSGVNVNLVYAMGGLGLWVDEADAADAQTFIDSRRQGPSTLSPLPAADAGARTLLSLVLTLLTGMVVPLRPRRPQRLMDERPAG